MMIGWMNEWMNGLNIREWKRRNFTKRIFFSKKGMKKGEKTKPQTQRREIKDIKDWKTTFFPPLEKNLNEIEKVVSQNKTHNK
jgi:hypothetical protein